MALSLGGGILGMPGDQLPIPSPDRYALPRLVEGDYAAVPKLHGTHEGRGISVSSHLEGFAQHGRAGLVGPTN